MANEEVMNEVLGQEESIRWLNELHAEAEKRIPYDKVLKSFTVAEIEQHTRMVSDIVSRHDDWVLPHGLTLNTSFNDIATITDGCVQFPIIITLTKKRRKLRTRTMLLSLEASDD